MFNLNRIWVAMLTQNTSGSNTNDHTALIINENGEDRLHHTFTDNMEQGQANLFEINVSGNNIRPNNLNDSSVRVAISGRDLWRPEHYIVWGELSLLRIILPIALETDLSNVVSADEGEGNISFPLRPIGRGINSMEINRLLVLMTTADDDITPRDSTGTDSDRIRLQITNGASMLDFEFPITPQADQERGRANLYFFPVDASLNKNDINSIRLYNNHNDAWLPQSFFVFGINEISGRPESLVPIVHIPNWTLGVLGTTDGFPSVPLPLVTSLYV